MIDWDDCTPLTREEFDSFIGMAIPFLKSMEDKNGWDFFVNDMSIRRFCNRFFIEAFKFNDYEDYQRYNTKVKDIQNDFITGPLGTPEAVAIVPKVKEKIEEAAENGDVIIYTRDTHFEDYLDTKEGKALPVPHCIYETDGWGLVEELDTLSHLYRNVYCIDKLTFGSKHLPEILKEDNLALFCNEIELVGVCTDICVVSNALILKSHFYQTMDITVDASCCAGTTPENHKAALRVMKSCQINVINE